MGNKQVKLGLRLDDKTFQAGSLVTGRVYLNVTQEVQADGLHLLLVGEEYSQICHDEHDHHHSSSGHRDYTTTHREIDRASASLVHMDVALTNFSSGKIAKGQYEYPFEWELPSNLPGSMYCAKADSHCEIRYRMTSYLHRAGSFREPDHSTTQAVCVVAQANPLHGPTGIVMDPEVVRIKSCCFDSGQVTLGWDVDKTVASPDSVMTIGINGANESNVEIECLRARLIETTTWSAHGRTEEETKTLTEAKISTANLPQWKSNHRHGHAHSYQHVGMDGTRESVVETPLLLPNEARDTYSGSIIQVRHSLVVTAVTPPCHTTVESGALIRVQRQSREPIAEATTIATAPYDFMLEPAFAEADILPEDWRPQEAHVVTLPLSSAVLLDTQYVPPTVSAPDESLVREHESPNTVTASLSDLLDSLACSDDPVSAVSHHLNNPMMAVTVQNLTPREFVQVLQAGNRDVPKLARLLAGAMDENFQCRHVLACVWSLPPKVRMEVLKEVAPLASDLETQRGMVERELDDQELLYFRAALK